MGQFLLNTHLSVLAVFISIVFTGFRFHCRAAYLNWTLSSIPAMLESTVSLKCQLHDSDKCVKDDLWIWSNGKDDNIISHKNITSDSTKYSAEINSCSEFSLYIHNFAEEDVNQVYSCEYSFLKASKMLSLSGNPFEYHPKSSDVRICKLYNGNTVFYNLTILKVYPKPDCDIFISNANHTRPLKSYVKKLKLFFEVQLETQLELDLEPNDETLNISCQIGQSRVSIDVRCFTRCLDNSSNTTCVYTSPEKELQSVYVVLICLAGFIVGFLAGCFIKWRKCCHRLGLNRPKEIYQLESTDVHGRQTDFENGGESDPL